MPPQMPRSVTVPCNCEGQGRASAERRQRLGLSGQPKDTVSLIVRLHYADGQMEDHALAQRRGVCRLYSPGRRSRLEAGVQAGQSAVALPGRACRRSEVVREIEFVKGPDKTAPIIMAATVGNACN